MANFSNRTFDTRRGHNDTVVFDDTGLIDGGSIGPNAGAIGYNTASVVPWLEFGIDAAGYGDVVSDVDAQFPSATFHYGINSGFTVVSNGGSTTTTFVDNGIEGTNGNDIVIDQVGDNIVDTNDGADLVLVGGGADAVRTGAGNDVVFSGLGDDIVSLGKGDDFAFLYDGNDAARGGGGKDEIHGEAGDDEIWGQGGHDRLFGGEGDDMLDGGGGKDRLDGGAGVNTLTGGKGRDVFVFGSANEESTITDFEAGRDKIEVDAAASGVSDFADLRDLQFGTTLVLRFDNGTLLLEDTTLADLDAGDFLFV